MARERGPGLDLLELAEDVANGRRSLDNVIDQIAMATPDDRARRRAVAELQSLVVALTGIRGHARATKEGSAVQPDATTAGNLTVEPRRVVARQVVPRQVVPRQAVPRGSGVSARSSRGRAQWPSCLSSLSQWPPFGRRRPSVGRRSAAVPRSESPHPLLCRQRYRRPRRQPWCRMTRRRPRRPRQLPSRQRRRPWVFPRS